MSVVLSIILWALAIACFGFVLVCFVIAAFILPRLVGSIKAVEIDGEKSLCVIIENEKDVKKLQKYSYVVLRSSDYISQK